ncbi:MAG TPA: PadR family transcriptional regulator [Pseudonocardiaceae bacterium]|nr:PadR family transcriptional regulator [Pseudonocardiaceae bacterium]
MPTGAAEHLDPAPRGRGLRPPPVPASRCEPGGRAEPAAASRGRQSARVIRGHVRYAVLAVLRHRPRHGYEIIQEIGTRSAGRWRPSPGSVYPTLAGLEGEGLIRTEQAQGRRVAHLTEPGHRYADEHSEQLAAVFEQFTDFGTDERQGLRETAAQVVDAAAEVGRAGTDLHMRLAREVLTETRRRLYRILADDQDPLRH